MEEEKKSVEVPVAEAGTESAPKLRPTLKPVISDPMAGRDTDTGNLEILTDTATRKTVKLKPIAPHPVVNPASRLSITPATLPRPAAPASTPVTPAAEPSAKPVVTASLSEEDKTVKVQRMPKAVAPADSSADKATVKLPSPAAKKPVTPPTPVKPPVAAPVAKPAPVTPVAPPVAKRPAPAPVAEPTTKLPVMNKQVAPAAKSAVPELSDAPETESAAASSSAAVMAAMQKKKSEDEEILTGGCTAMQVISTLLIACVVVMMILQFVDIIGGTDYSSFIPGMNFSK